MQEWQRKIVENVPEGPPANGETSDGTDGNTIKSKSLWTYVVGLLVMAVITLSVMFFETLKVDRNKVEQEIRQTALKAERDLNKVERRADSLSQALDRCKEQRVDDFFNNVKFKEGPNKITITKKK